MTDNVAVLEGYTEGYLADCTEYDMFILVKPGTDFDSTFKAWDSDNQEFVSINGWLWVFTKVED